MVRTRRLVGGVLAVLLAGGTFAYWHFDVSALGAAFTGGAARLMCSAVFVADRDEAIVFEQDFQRRTSPGTYLGWARVDVDEETGTVTSSLWGWQSRTAVHRDGIGCTTAQGGVSVEDLRDQGEGVATALPQPDPAVLWPEGAATLEDDLPDGVDADVLRAAVDEAFEDADPDRPTGTRSVVVVHGGRIVAERHAPGFDEDTAHLSNSVAKSVTATLIGILVGRGELELDEPAPIPEWHGPDDPRRAITLEHLLRMTSGLSFGETYDQISSDITLQWHTGDLAGYAASRPLEAEPGTTWHYSTGTANILGRIVAETAGPDLASAFAFPRQALFEPIEMRTAVLEPDASGNFIGGSSVYASTRDYARLGLLYLQDGVWEGERILPEGWVEFVTEPTAGSPPEYPYGAQFWLNWNGVDDERREPDLPDDTYFMNGHQGQHVVIVPSLDLVVARNGLSEFDTWDVGDLVADVISALPDG